MKKIMAAALVLCMCMVLAGCSSKVNLVTGYKKGDVTLGQYKGLTYTKTSTEISEEDVENEIQSRLEMNAESADVTDRPVKTGDIVNIDFVGKVDGVEFDNGSGTDTDLEIGSGRMIPGFEDGIIGMNNGDTKVIDVTFPDEYPNNPDLAGVAATFDITVNSITEKVIPSLEDYVATKDEYSSADDFRAAVRSELETEAVKNADDQKFNDIIEKAVGNSTFNTDMTEAISAIKTNLYSNYNSIASAYNLDAATLFSYMYGMSTEEFDAYVDEQAKSSAEYNYLLSAVVEAEKIKATDKEVEDYAQTVLSSYGVDTTAALYEMIKNTTGKDGKLMLTEQVKLNKASDLIIDSAIEE
ncbi:MAG: trigger factor [Lachnospiraceae bacterium]|nr:trigger factor [Lachnospiraceae bacterium]